MSSSVTSASKALEAYISDFEKTGSDISDYYSLPPSLEIKQHEQKKDGQRKAKRTGTSGRKRFSSNERLPTDKVQSTSNLNSVSVNGSPESKAVAAENLFRLCDTLYGEAISIWKAEQKKDSKIARSGVKRSSKSKTLNSESPNSKSKSPNSASRMPISTSKTTARTSPPKDFFAHYAECVAQMKLDADRKTTFVGDGNRAPPSWIERLSSIVGDRDPTVGRLTWPKEDDQSDSTSQDDRVIRGGASSFERHPPSWIDNLSPRSEMLVADQDEDEHLVCHERPPRAPSWVDKVYEDRISSISKSKQSTSNLASSQNTQQNQLPYRDMLHHLFQQQDVRLQRLKLAKQLTLAKKKSEQGQNSAPAPTSINRNSPAKRTRGERKKFAHSKPVDEGDDDDSGDDEKSTDILLSTSAYGRSNEEKNETRKIPLTPNTNDAEIVSARLIDVEFRDAEGQPEDHLESELAGDRSWEKLPNGSPAHDGVLKNIMDKR